MARTNFFGQYLVTAVMILASSWASGATLYGVQSASGAAAELITIDTATGSPTPVGTVSGKIDGIAFAPDGTLYAADNTNNQLVTLDPANGSVLSVIGPYVAADVIEGLAVRPSDSVLFGVDTLNDTICTLDTTTGTATVVGTLTVSDLMGGLAFNLNGSVLYGVDWGNGCLYTINQSTAAETQVGCGAAGVTGGPLGLARDPVTGTLYLAEYRSSSDTVLAIVSEADGSRTTVGTVTGYSQIEGLSFDEEVPVELMHFSID